MKVKIVFIILILSWLLLSCTNIKEVSTSTTLAPLAVSSGVGSKYSIQYDLAFRKWGEFYFPFDDWKWWKSQGIAESDLDPKAVSWCGAQGIMQIMPKTGIGLGLKNPWDPEESIQAGIKYDSQVDKYFKEISQPERRKFMFAGYNAGMGNINKARKMVGNDEWSDAADKLPLITGKANSAETTGYVSRIYKLKQQLM